MDCCSSVSADIHWFLSIGGFGGAFSIASYGYADDGIVATSESATMHYSGNPARTSEFAFTLIVTVNGVCSITLNGVCSINVGQQSFWLYDQLYLFRKLS